MTHVNEIEDEAMRWVVRSESGLGDEQSLELDKWLGIDPRHREAYERMTAVWAKAGGIQALRPLDGPIDADLFEPREKYGPVSEPRMVRWHRPPLAAAALAALIVAGVCFEKHSTDDVYATETGQFSDFQLRDGSRIDLNTDTQLEVEFTPLSRRVWLERGEARFNVAYDPLRAFEVHAGGTIIRAAGTEFSVRLLGQDALVVLVASGTVKIQRAVLREGDVGTLNEAGFRAEHLGSERIRSKFAWTVGFLEFEKATLAEVVAEFNRYSQEKLVILDPSVRNLEIGGRFRAKDLQGLADVLSGKFQIAVDLTGEGKAEDAQIILAASKQSSR